MLSKLNKVVFVTGLILVAALVGCDSLPFTGSQDGGIKASGVVEAVNVFVAPELSGRVAEVYVDEGDQVEVGDPLLRMDDELLQTQREQILAELESARANQVAAEAGLELALATLNTAEVNVEAAKSAAEVEKLPAEQSLQELYDNIEVTRGEALKIVSEASRAVRDAQYQFDNFTIPVNQQDMTAMEAVSVMKERLDEAREKFEPYKYRSSSNPTRQDLKEDLDDAQSEFDSAVRRLEYETNLRKAHANLDKAVSDLAKLQEGPDPDDIAVLEAQIVAADTAVKQAEASAEQARVGVSRSDAVLEQARAALAQANAALNQVDKQIERLEVRSAVDGVVLLRNVQPGEVIQPGIPTMTLGELDNLTVTVYIPEESYGRIKLGDSAILTADSFPGETFEAVVTRIADRAEFTPRNVQTQEDRRTIVFAIELTVNDQSGRLKPGMPADVTFSE
jgi:HlyD family secretion protein